MKNNNSNFRNLLDDRFGMFVHYGIYSAMAGSFEGQEVAKLGEWIQRWLEIPNKKYEAFGRKHFCPRPDFAQNLVSYAKQAGVKYIVLTSKHHDGFCLFKSDYTDYSTYEFYGRDICKELADECKKQGLGLGLYYSHTLDWHEKDAAGNVTISSGTSANNRNFWDFPDDNIDFDKYLYGKCFPQVRELLTNYGDLKLIWFDFPHDITRAQSEELRNLVKSIQPDCLINSRIAHDCNDYESLGDNALPTAPVGENLECLITLNDTWGYKKNDHNWKTPAEVLEIFCRTLASDSTLLLNVGPMGDGSLTPETIDILTRIGEWTQRNGEAIYGEVKGNPFSNIFSWGSVSLKGKNLYIYPNETAKKEIIINLGEINKIKSVSVIGSEKSVDYEVNDGILKIHLQDTDFIAPVYKVEFEEVPHFSKEILQHDDTVNLGVLWASKFQKGKEDSTTERLVYEKGPFTSTYGTHGLCANQVCQSDFWTDSNEILCWDVHFAEKGSYNATLITAPFEPAEDGCDFILTLGGKSNFIDTKKEKKNIYLSRTKEGNHRESRDAGVFYIETPGKYKVYLERTPIGKDKRVEIIKLVKI